MTNVRVLVVDDSSTMRSLICNALSRDSEIEVVGMARDPLEAREAMKALNPDVVTLDVEMPNMNGLDFLEKIMRLRPTPVIMVSNLTSHGTEETIKALEIGAFDCVAKPSPGEALMFADLSAKVKAAAAARVHLAPRRSRRVNDIEKPADAPIDYMPGGKIVAIGASTGGVEALIAVVSRFPENCPPTVITQHMPGTFTKSFAERLNRSCAARVCEASDGAPLVPGHVYLAPGGVAHLEVAPGNQMKCRLNTLAAVNGHRPSVDVLFEFGRDGGQGPGGRRDPHRHGPRWRRGARCDAQGRR